MWSAALKSFLYWEGTFSFPSVHVKTCIWSVTKFWSYKSIGLGLFIFGGHFRPVLTLRDSWICKLHSCFSLVRLPIVCKSALTGYDSVSYYSVYQLRCPFGFTELVIALVKLVWTYFTDLFQNTYFYPFWLSSGSLFAEGLKHSTAEISESVNVSQNTLLSMSFFSSSFDLLIVKSWQRHLTSLFHVFVSRQRWILSLSFLSKSGFAVLYYSWVHKPASVRCLESCVSCWFVTRDKEKLGHTVRAVAEVPQSIPLLVLLISARESHGFSQNFSQSFSQAF